MINRFCRRPLRVTTAAFLSYLLVILTCVPFSTTARSIPAAKVRHGQWVRWRLNLRQQHSVSRVEWVEVDELRQQSGAVGEL
jgi:hypothetical protein